LASRKFVVEKTQNSVSSLLLLPQFVPLNQFAVLSLKEGEREFEATGEFVFQKEKRQWDNKPEEKERGETETERERRQRNNSKSKNSKSSGGHF